MRIATWNVNSIKQRIDSALTWLAERKPDIVCLQETKCVDDAFPREPFEALGYNLAVHGQKTFNGVALLSKFPFDEVTNGLPGDDSDDHARFIEGGGLDGAGRAARRQHLSAQRQSAGDRQIHLQARLDEAAVRLCARAAGAGRAAGPGRRLQRHSDGRPTPAIRRPGSTTRCSCRARATQFRALINLGLTDALRATSDEPGLYTFWDYQAGAWQKNNGIRIDHLLLSPPPPTG